MAGNMSYRYGIVGQGAIGLGLVDILAQEHCTLFGRAALTAQNHPEQLSIHINETATLTQKDVAYAYKQLSLAQELDYLSLDVLILPVKFYQLPALLGQLNNKLPATLPLMLLQNGFGGHESLAACFPHNPIYIASTTDAIVKSSALSIQVNARGELIIGSTSQHEPCPAIKRILQQHPNAKWDKDILNYLYQKLAVNAVINPITAIYGCKNGGVLNYPALVEGLKQEVFRLYQALALDIDLTQLGQYIDSVIHLTRNNFSSMQQDLQLGRPTELEGILGSLIKKAATHKVPLPLIKSLYTDIQTLENKSHK
jgi:2-dehydropantoate 2-reductase